MVLFYVTNAALEISFGAAWWLATKTTSGLYNGINYLIYGSNELTEEQIRLLDNNNIGATIYHVHPKFKSESPAYYKNLIHNYFKKNNS